MARRVYRTVAVKKVSLEKVVASLPEGAVQAGSDIGKEVIVTVLRDSRGKFLKAWKTRQPSELRELVGLLTELGRHRPLVVAMESTGTDWQSVLRGFFCTAGVSGSFLE